MEKVDLFPQAHVHLVGFLLLSYLSGLGFIHVSAYFGRFHHSRLVVPSDVLEFLQINSVKDIRKLL